MAVKGIADSIVDKQSNYVNLSDILLKIAQENELLYGEEIEERIYDWLDKNCCDDPYTRWTSHGYSISHDWDKVKCEIFGMKY